MRVFIVIWIRFPGGSTHPRCFSDNLFIAHPHSGTPPPFEWRQSHEGLVIKPRREESPKQAVDRTKIESDTWPGVLAAGDKALVKRLGGRPHVGILFCALAHCDQGTGFLHPCGHDSPGAVVLETAAEDLLAIGHEG